MAALSNGLEGLLVFDNEGALQPRLAESWSQPDANTIVYQIRQGVTFWDGSPLTADDVAFSMGQHIDPEGGSQLATFFGSVESIEATSASEVLVKLKQPDPAFTLIPAAQAGLIVQKTFSEEHESDIGTPEVLTMGTGPYTITEYVPDQGVTLERNESYWGERPAVKQVSLKFIVEDATRLLAMQSGEIDGAFQVPIDQVPQWEEIDGVTILTAPELSVYFLSLDVEAAPFDDIHVRRAFAYALDRDGLVNAVFRGKAQPANSLVPPGQWASVLPADEVAALYATFPDYQFDLAKAEEELAQSSQASGFEVSVVYPDSVPQLGKILLSLSENLKQIGVTLDVEQVTSDKWLNDIYAREGSLGMQSMVFVPDFPDPSNYPPVLLGSQHAVKNDFNLANYKNPQVDELLTEQQTSADNAVRARALGEVLKIAQTDLPYLPVLWPDTAMAIKSDFVYTGYSALWFDQPWATKVQPAA